MVLCAAPLLMRVQVLVLAWVVVVVVMILFDARVYSSHVWLQLTLIQRRRAIGREI